MTYTEAKTYLIENNIPFNDENLRLSYKATYKIITKAFVNLPECKILQEIHFDIMDNLIKFLSQTNQLWILNTPFYYENKHHNGLMLNLIASTLNCKDNKLKYFINFINYLETIEVEFPVKYCKLFVETLKHETPLDFFYITNKYAIPYIDTHIHLKNLQLQNPKLLDLLKSSKSPKLDFILNISYFSENILSYPEQNRIDSLINEFYNDILRFNVDTSKLKSVKHLNYKFKIHDKNSKFIGLTTLSYLRITKQAPLETILGSNFMNFVNQVVEHPKLGGSVYCTLKELDYIKSIINKIPNNMSFEEFDKKFAYLRSIGKVTLNIGEILSTSIGINNDLFNIIKCCIELNHTMLVQEVH